MNKDITVPQTGALEASVVLQRLAAIQAELPHLTDLKSVKAMSDQDIDMVAFVALDIRETAYFCVEDIRARSGGLKLLMEFRSNQKIYTATTRPGGLSTMRNIQDFPFYSRRPL